MDSAPLPPAHATAQRREIATAQMRRDRARLAAAQQELHALRSAAPPPAPPILRALARQAFLRLPQPVQRAALALRPPRPAPPPGAEAAPAPARGRALVIDDHWPRPDRDAGSIEIVNLVQALLALGFQPLLAAGREHAAPSPARDALQALGLPCLTPAHAPSVEAFLAAQGHTLDLCVLCRVYCGGRFLEPALRHARQARILFHSIDLHYLRLERQARLDPTPDAIRIAAEVRAREQQVMRESDATIVVSAAELDHLHATLPEVRTLQLPLARPVVPPATPFAARSGIGFIGGFAHAPNLDAMRHFLSETWPLVLRQLPDLELAIVGADMPPDLLEAVPGQVRALGPVPDIAPWFEGLRLTIAPLRFGAGAKGKIASSLAAGVPCIATPIAAEGMDLSEEAGVPVADSPAAFAAALVAAYRDPARWAALSRGALAYARTTLSPEAWRARLDGLLRDMAL